MVAHRGASAREVENSLAAFRVAAQLGADAIELDILAAADGVLFVHHDEVVSGVHITRSCAGARTPTGTPSMPSITGSSSGSGPGRPVCAGVC